MLEKTVPVYNYDSKEGQLIELALMAKGIDPIRAKPLPHTIEPTDEPVIQDRDSFIRGTNTILEFLEEKYPEPCLSRDNPEDRAMVRMLFSDMKSDALSNDSVNPTCFSRYRPHLQSKFVLGNKLSILDLGLAVSSPNDPEFNAHRTRVKEALA